MLWKRGRYYTGQPNFSLNSFPWSPVTSEMTTAGYFGWLTNHSQGLWLLQPAKLRGERGTVDRNELNFAQLRKVTCICEYVQDALYSISVEQLYLAAMPASLFMKPQRLQMQPA